MSTSSTGFEVVVGGLTDIGVGGHHVVGVNSSGDFYYYEHRWDNDLKWRKLDGAGTMIRAAADGSLVCCNANGDAYFMNNPNGDWFELGNKGFTRVAVGSKDHIWGVDKNGGIHQYVWNKGWVTVDGGLADIAVGSDGTVWGVNSAGNIYRYEGNNQWHQIDGGLKRISVGDVHHIAGVNKDGEIYVWNVGAQKWDLRANETADSIAFTDSDFWITKGSTIKRYAFPAREWRQQPIYGFSKISVGSKRHVCAVDKKGKLWKQNSDGSWRQLNGGGVDISVGDDGQIWVVNADGDIYVSDDGGENYKLVDGKLATVSCGNKNFVWGINSSGKIYKYNPSSGTWAEIDGGAEVVAVGADADVWVVNNIGNVYRWNSVNSSWDHVGAAPKLKHISCGDKNSVVGITDKGGIYKWDNEKGSFYDLGGGGSHAAIGHDGVTYIVNDGGDVYHHGWNQL